MIILSFTYVYFQNLKEIMSFIVPLKRQTDADQEGIPTWNVPLSKNKGHPEKTQTPSSAAHNNVHRSQKVSKTGAPVYRIKVDRSGKKSVVPVKVKKCYKWQDTIFENCVDGLRTGNIPQHQVE